MSITGTELNILYIDGDTFNKIPGGEKVVFRLLLTSEDTLTLGAWTAPGVDYDGDDPLFILTTGSKSGFKWAANTFFGDQKIGSRNVRKIQAAITSAKPYVIFMPRLHSDLSNQIAFDVSVDKLEDLAGLLSVAMTNPSPPRSSRVAQ